MAITDLAERGHSTDVKTRSSLGPAFAWHRWDRYSAFLLFSLSLLYLCLFRRFTSMEPDEGILLQGAQRILSGEVPYRDFFAFYTPGSYYSLALLFKIFGSSIVVARTALALAGAVLSLITYLLARRVCSQSIALMMAALATLTSVPYRFLILHNWDSTLLACLAIYCAVRLLEVPSLKWAFVLGSIVSITVLFEQSKGAGVCLGLGAGFLAIFLLPGSTFRPSRGHVLGFLLGVAWPMAITFAYFAAQHAAITMVADWFWPLLHYSVANRVPYGYQHWSDDARQAILVSGSLPVRAIALLTVSPFLWIPALPLLVGCYFLYWIVRVRRSPGIDDKSRYYILLTASFAGLSLSAMLTRTNILHFMYLQPLNCVVLAWLIEGRDIPGRLVKSVRPLLAGYIGIAFLAIGMVPLLTSLSARNRLETRRGEVFTQGKDTVVEYVQAHVPEGGTILVYPYLPLYYYLTGTFSPGRYEYFQPGMHTREQANQMMAELASRPVNAVLFEVGFPEKIPHAWPSTAITDIAHDPVGDYIMKNFHSCATLKAPDGWSFVYMVRRDSQCP